MGHAREVAEAGEAKPWWRQVGNWVSGQLDNVLSTIAGGWAAWKLRHLKFARLEDGHISVRAETQPGARLSYRELVSDEGGPSKEHAAIWRLWLALPAKDCSGVQFQGEVWLRRRRRWEQETKGVRMGWFRKTAKDYHYLEEGTRHSMRGEYGRAIKALSKALEADPQNAVAYMHRGIAFLNSGQVKKALQDFGAACVWSRMRYVTTIVP